MRKLLKFLSGNVIVGHHCRLIFFELFEAKVQHDLSGYLAAVFQYVQNEIFISVFSLENPEEDVHAQSERVNLFTFSNFFGGSVLVFFFMQTVLINTAKKWQMIEKSEMLELIIELKPYSLWQEKQHTLKCSKHFIIALLKTNGSNQIFLD
mgnify:CR=1 FL=1